MSTDDLNNQETAYLCRSIAGLLHAGISAAEACYLLCEEADPRLADLLKKLVPLLDEGILLGEALLRCGSFPTATAGLIRAGEQTGYLEEALLSAADFHEARDASARQLRTALGYPGMLLTLMLIVVGVLLVQVLPVFDSVYASLGSRLTGIAGGLLHLGQWLKQLLPLLFLLIFLILTAMAAYRFCAAFRKAVLCSIQRLTDDRWLWRAFANARFVQALSMGIRSGLTPEESISLASELLRDSPGAAARCKECLKQIGNGAALPEALQNNGLMSPSACRLLSAGLKGGNGDRILEDIARQMQNQAEQQLEDSLSKIEPAMVLISSILVGAILMSVMLPLMNILSALG